MEKYESESIGNFGGTEISVIKFVSISGRSTPFHLHVNASVEARYIIVRSNRETIAIDTDGNIVEPDRIFSLLESEHRDT